MLWRPTSWPRAKYCPVRPSHLVNRYIICYSYWQTSVCTLGWPWHAACHVRSVRKPYDKDHSNAVLENLLGCFKVLQSAGINISDCLINETLYIKWPRLNVQTDSIAIYNRGYLFSLFSQCVMLRSSRKIQPRYLELDYLELKSISFGWNCFQSFNIECWS